MDFNKFSRNVEKIFDWLPSSWQQSAFSGKRCTAQFPIPQVKVPSHSSSLSQSPSWSPHLLCFVQQFQELPLLLQVSWPLQLVASSHATTKDKKEGSFKFCFEYPLNPFKFSLTRATDTHNKRNNLPKLQFFKMIRIFSHTQISLNWQNWCFANLSVSLVKKPYLN